MKKLSQLMKAFVCSKVKKCRFKADQRYVMESRSRLTARFFPIKKSINKGYPFYRGWVYRPQEGLSTRSHMGRFTTNETE